MTSLRTAAEITGASFALIALLPMTALLPACPRGTVAINGRASEIEAGGGAVQRVRRKLGRKLLKSFNWLASGPTLCLALSYSLNYLKRAHLHLISSDWDWLLRSIFETCTASVRCQSAKWWKCRRDMHRIAAFVPTDLRCRKILAKWGVLTQQSGAKSLEPLRPSHRGRPIESKTLQFLNIKINGLETR